MSPLDQGPACQKDVTEKELVTGHSPRTSSRVTVRAETRAGNPSPCSCDTPEPHRDLSLSRVCSTMALAVVRWGLLGRTIQPFGGWKCERRGGQFLFSSLERLFLGRIDSMWTSLFWRLSAETQLWHYFSLKVNNVLHVNTQNSLRTITYCRWGPMIDMSTLCMHIYYTTCEVSSANMGTAVYFYSSLYFVSSCGLDSHMLPKRLVLLLPKVLRQVLQYCPRYYVL